MTTAIPNMQSIFQRLTAISQTPMQNPRHCFGDQVSDRNRDQLATPSSDDGIPSPLAKLLSANGDERLASEYLRSSSLEAVGDDVGGPISNQIA